MKQESKIPRDASLLQDLQRQVQTLSTALTQQILLRDCLLLISTANNPYDRAIVEKLIAGVALADGEWTHIFEETAKLNLPEAHKDAMQTIYLRLQKRKTIEALKSE